MKNIIFLIIFFPVVLNGNDLDSLYKKLLSAGEDTQKINILNKIAEKLLINHLAKGIQYAEEAVELSKKNNYKRGKISAYYILGTYYSERSEYQKALNYYFKCIKECSHDSCNSHLDVIYNDIGRIFYYQANYEQSLEYFLKVLSIRKKRKDTSGIARIYNNIGVIYHYQKKLDKSLEYYFKSLEIEKRLAYKRGIAISYNNIGEIYRERQEYDRALDYYFKSIELKREIGDSLALAYTYNNIGMVYQIQSKFAQALKYHLNSLEIIQKLGDKFDIAETKYSIGLYYHRVKKYNKAINYLKDALQTAQSIKAMEIIKKISYELSQIYSAISQYKSAYEYYVLYKQVSDTLYNEANVRRMAQIEAKHEFEELLKRQEFLQKQEQMEQMNKIKYQKVLNYSLFVGFLLMLLLSFTVFRAYQIKQKANRILKIQKQELELEKKNSEYLLNNILPEKIAQELQDKGKIKAKQYRSVSVLFADFKSFTRLTAMYQPMDLLNELDNYFAHFDRIIERYNIEKIKTIGDAYMCAGGVPEPDKDNPIKIVLAAFEIQNFITEINHRQKQENKPLWQLRIGIHTGDVVAGVIGKKRIAYDIWGDTVNIANRMEEAGEPGKINISEETYKYIKNFFECNFRGNIRVKHRGKIGMYFVEHIKPQYSKDTSGHIPQDDFVKKYIKIFV